MPDHASKHTERTNEANRAKAAPQRRGPTLAAGPSPAQLSGAVDNPQAASPLEILALQQRYGNQAVQRLIQRVGEDGQQSRFDLNTARGMWKYLSLKYHPDKGPEPWRAGLMTKINAAANNLPELRRLKAEGERLAGGGGAPTTTPPQSGGPQITPPQIGPQPNPEQALTPTGNQEGQLVPTGGNSGALVPTGGNSGALVLVNNPPTPTGAKSIKLPRPLVRPTPPGGLRMQLVAHNTKLRPLLKKYMDGLNMSAVYNFYFDAHDNRRVYDTYFKGTATNGPHVSADVRKALTDLAAQRDWQAMAGPMNNARIENQEYINEVVLPGFAETPEYQAFKATDHRDRSPLARLAGAMRRGFQRGRRGGGPVQGPQEPAQMQQTRRVVAMLERAIERYTAHYQHYMRELPRTEPTQEQLDFLLREGQQIHARVATLFARQYAADSTLRRERYAAFFTKLAAFTKLWNQYKALLQRTSPTGHGSGQPLGRPRGGSLLGNSLSDLPPENSVPNPTGSQGIEEADLLTDLFR